MAQDVPSMRQGQVDKLEKESLGASLLEVTEVTRLVGSVVVQVGIAIFGSSVFQGTHSVQDLIEAEGRESCYRRLGAVLGKQPTCSLVRVWP